MNGGYSVCWGASGGPLPCEKEPLESEVSGLAKSWSLNAQEAKV
jgi:hypothetical protein